jgi:hypothetical protein
MATKTRGRSNRRPPKHTPEERAAQWEALASRLAEWEGCTCEDKPALGDPHEEGCEADIGMIAAALAMHDGYSPRNACLIASQDEQATDVRGYRMWQEAGRQVTEYPLDEQAIMIVSYRGEAKAKDGGEAPAETTPKPETAPGAGGEAKKPSLRFGLGTVHDIRRTIALFCGDCGRPIHRTGSDGRFPVWGHTGLPADLGHKARKTSKDETAPPMPEGAAEVAQAWHAARSAKAGNPPATAIEEAAEIMAAGDDDG